MDHLLPKLNEMDFSATNLEQTWKKWIKNMKFYLTAVMKTKTDEERYSAFLFLNGERGRDIYNTWTWEKKRNQDGEEIDKLDISLDKIIKKFEEYCTPKKNVVLERRRFFLRKQEQDESIDTFVTQLRNLYQHVTSVRLQMV